jgi:hypothetical protein
MRDPDIDILECEGARGGKETKNTEEIDGVKIAIIFCHWLYHAAVIHSFCHTSLELGKPLYVWQASVQGETETDKDIPVGSCNELLS